MKVFYKEQESVLQKIRSAVYQAKCENRIVEEIALNDDEVMDLFCEIARRIFLLFALHHFNHYKKLKGYWISPWFTVSK